MSKLKDDVAAWTELLQDSVSELRNAIRRSEIEAHNQCETALEKMNALVSNMSNHKVENVQVANDQFAGGEITAETATRLQGQLQELDGRLENQEKGLRYVRT